MAIVSGVAAAYARSYREIAQNLAGVAIAVALVSYLSVFFPVLAGRPALAAMVAIGLVATFAQVGPLFSVEALAFRGSRIDPLKGMKRLVSAERLFELAKALLKLGLVMGAAVLVLMIVLLFKPSGLFGTPPVERV